MTLIGHYKFIRTHQVLLQLVVKSLSRNLDADAKHDRCVDNLLLQSCIQNTAVTLSVFFDGVVLLVLRRHDLIQMNLIVQKVVEVQALKRLQHLLNALLKVLD